MNIVARILEVISRYPEGVPQSYLAKALGVSKSYLSFLLRTLEKQGVIYRTRVGNLFIVRKAVNQGAMIGPRDRVFRLGIVWSSEYLFLGYFVKMLRGRENIEINISIYPNAIQTVLALIRGEVDAILSPLVTQIYGYILSKGLAIVGGVAGGGGYVYEIPQGSSDVVISSELSTMDLCRVVALRRNYIDSSTVKYFDSSQEAIAMIRRGLARYAVVWHPINIEVEAVGGKKILSCAELEETSHCCTFAVSRALGYEAIEKISQIYRESIEYFNKNKERYLDWYSAIVGIDVSILKKALNEYTYDPNIDLRYFVRVVGILGMEVPTKTQLYQAIQF